MKNFSISFSDWVFNTYLKNYNGNRSKFIEEKFIKGFELDEGEFENTKQKLIRLSQLTRNQEDKLAKLEKELGRYKKIYDDAPDPKKKAAMDLMKSMSLGQ